MCNFVLHALTMNSHQLLKLLLSDVLFFWALPLQMGKYMTKESHWTRVIENKCFFLTCL